MEIVLEAITEWATTIIVDIIGSNIEGMLTLSAEQAASLSGDIVNSPANYSPSVWSMVNSIADVVIVPIAAMILTAVMCIELIGWVNDKNNFKDASEAVVMLFKFIIKLFIGVTLVQKSPEITLGIFELTAYLVEHSAGIVTGGSLDTAISVEAMKAILMEKEWGYLSKLLITSFLGNIGLFAISIGIQVLLIGRMIEIYLYCSMGAIPYATLMNKEIGRIGQNYIKNLFALAFQGFFIIVIVAIYGVLTNDVVLSDDPLAAINTMLLMSVVLCFSLFRSKAFAKSIFNAS